MTALKWQNALIKNENYAFWVSFQWQVGYIGSFSDNKYIVNSMLAFQSSKRLQQNSSKHPLLCKRLRSRVAKTHQRVIRLNGFTCIISNQQSQLCKEQTKLIKKLISCNIYNPNSRNVGNLKLGAAPEELSAFNIWPSLNIEPTLSQISEETLENLKLRERNSRASNSTQSQTSPEWRHATTTRGIPSSHTDHFNLKASIKQPLFRWNWSYLSLK